jgi:hypothetical protein
MIALTLSMYMLAFASWAIDLRILWLELFVLLPQRMSDSPPSDDLATAVKRLNGCLQFAHACCFTANVCYFMPHIAV